MWSNCVGLCTDGARSMSGHKAGLQALVKRKHLTFSGRTACSTEQLSYPKIYAKNLTTFLQT